MSRPVVLCFSGHDPSGGAGIQADIETLVSHRCHAASIITALTEQDSRNVKRLLPQRAEDVASQARTLMADFTIAAVKIGLLGDAAVASAIADIVRTLPGVPIVLDTILAAGGGTSLASQALQAAIVGELLPLATLVTPNSLEARRLTAQDDLGLCGQALRDMGAQYALITGAHEGSEQVCNQLFMPDGLTQNFTWDRLPHSYHGSGCTLASAVAALLAQGLDMFTAVSEAQDFTWQSLAAGYQPGRGQHNPNRLFWMES
ncbi:MAG: hydroxymethylpyrimidine/phosphomethylpyrimidine kinase [Methylomonas sp.]|nr:hydroxymethylpyrimidine/phosphomethylpyrimidine kinase [Methylomonas sp.]PPD19792.1 MAG: hydroxymethylpyrimidine/phosphomethylpyrimidine kinase [Methylomonas sp.]PPD25783.1 MAG: hydroxymethylpyrimidine/phosphomethylpyrimidine kinase [Methylomonas sp.]PPD36969.1 MAG: hydroxymethylpyrimidine/phosphomethylpyrimidine kinase [Methylomonas sp.]PPD37247.1 MAG: hydroxymethylpyrimidine/phosphomethylpyrimidine kinase [Methylomonas sp.]